MILAGALVSPPSAGAEDPFRTLSLIRPTRPTAAPEFTARGLYAPSVRLSDFKGHVVFLNFWATWCPPCKEEMPSMERLYRRHKERRFTVLAISIDRAEDATVAAFVKSLGLTFPIALDPRMEIAERYKVRALPSSFLIDRQGYMAAVALGPRQWDGPAAHAAIADLLK
ncbi:MAG TPA: TlpA disulfide reductase family protein [Candidatus Binatia bacterium]|nr:TlpA disulfide reductase family protein [Candidatus Binatia bacterium]